MKYEIVCGLEVHVEMNTKTKIFCGCTTAFGGAPNTHTCPVCTGQPGALPVLNRAVVEGAMSTGLALGCEITRLTRFDRKNYFYPDLPKAYQISQLYAPICTGGGIAVTTDGGEEKYIRLHEIHMEEDAGKLVHDPWTESTLCDYNRWRRAADGNCDRAGLSLCARGHRFPDQAAQPHCNFSAFRTARCRKAPSAPT